MTAVLMISLLLPGTLAACSRSIEHHLQMASDYFGDNNYEQAVVEYSKAIELNPDNETAKIAYTFRGYSYYDLGQYDLAIPDFLKVMEMDSTNMTIRQHLGDSYYKTGQYNLAIAEFTKMIEIDPKYSPYIYDNRGLVYYTQQNYQLAIEDFTKAVTQFSGDALGYSRRADAYIATGQTDLAIADLRKTISIAEDSTLKQSAQDRLASLGVSG